MLHCPTIHSLAARVAPVTHRIHKRRPADDIALSQAVGGHRRSPATAAAILMPQLAERRSGLGGVCGASFHCLRLSAITFIAVIDAWLRLA
jgi:hypothetical protein